MPPPPKKYTGKAAIVTAGVTGRGVARFVPPYAGKGGITVTPALGRGVAAFVNPIKPQALQGIATPLLVLMLQPQEAIRAPVLVPPKATGGIITPLFLLMLPAEEPTKAAVVTSFTGSAAVGVGS